jgi:SAM-dependent methyltransferase
MKSPKYLPAPEFSGREGQKEDLQNIRSDKLNLGSGRFPLPGFHNVDLDPAAQPDQVLNLNQTPYPYPANTFAEVEARHVLEHLHDVFAVMREIHRILKPGGVVRISVPHFSRGMTHADHKRCFDLSFPYYFKPEFRGGYCGVKFDLVSQKFVWWALRDLKRTILPLPVRILGFLIGNLFDLLANLCPPLCSRVWCFWVGGFEEIRFVLKKPN